MHREDSTGQRLEASGLADYAAAACTAAAALPPIAVCAAENRPQTQAALEALRLAVACFLARSRSNSSDAGMNASSGGAGESTDDGTSIGRTVVSAADERVALLALLRRQLAGERAATAARLAERRLWPAAADAAAAAADPLHGSVTEQAAAGAVTSLVLAALTYCWQDLAEQVCCGKARNACCTSRPTAQERHPDSMLKSGSQPAFRLGKLQEPREGQHIHDAHALQEWDAIFKRTQAGLSAACVALEDVAEAVSSAAVAAAGAYREHNTFGVCALSLHQIGTAP